MCQENPLLIYLKIDYYKNFWQFQSQESRRIDYMIYSISLELSANDEQEKWAYQLIQSPSGLQL
jgi:hypothetical protein